MPEEVKEGMPETIDVAVLATEVTLMVVDWISTGKMEWTDLIGLAEPIQAAVEGIGNIPEEWETVTAEEINSVAQAIIDVLLESDQIADEKILQYASLAGMIIEVAFDVVGIVEAVKDILDTE